MNSRLFLAFSRKTLDFVAKFSGHPTSGPQCQHTICKPYGPLKKCPYQFSSHVHRPCLLFFNNPTTQKMYAQPFTQSNVVFSLLLLVHNRSRRQDNDNLNKKCTSNKINTCLFKKEENFKKRLEMKEGK